MSEKVSYRGNATYEYVVPLVIFFIATGALLSIGDIQQAIPGVMAKTMNGEVSGSDMSLHPLATSVGAGESLAAQARANGDLKCFSDGTCINLSQYGGSVDTTGSNGDRMLMALASRELRRALRGLPREDRLALMGMIQQLANEGHEVGDFIGDLEERRDEYDNVNRRLRREYQRLNEMGEDEMTRRQINRLRELRSQLSQEISQSETQVARADGEFQQIRRVVENQLQQQGLQEVEVVIEQETEVISQNAQQAANGGNASANQVHGGANNICSVASGGNCMRANTGGGGSNDSLGSDDDG